MLPEYPPVFYHSLGLCLGRLAGGRVFEPWMAAQSAGTLLIRLFGSGKGSGAAMLFFFLGLLGLLTCLVFRRDRHIWALERHD